MIAIQTNRQRGNKTMVNVKVCELSGKALDYAVAVCEGVEVKSFSESPALFYGKGFEKYSPSTNWAIAGPIIEREKITIKYTGSLLEFCACTKTGNGKFTELPPDFVQYANNPLIAAMRCYVASKMGGSVEIPDNLL